MMFQFVEESDLHVSFMKSKKWVHWNQICYHRSYQFDSLYVAMSLACVVNRR